MVIYKITNLINGKIYVGQDMFNNPNYYGSGKILVKSIKKYGKENFTKEIIEVCSSLAELDEREIFWIKKLNSTNRDIGYNICDGGRSYRSMRGENNPRYGVKLSEETKQKIREKRKHQKMSQKEKDRLSDLWKGDKNPGKNKSKETIKKLKEAAKNIDRKGENHPMYGKKHTDEIKEKWSKNRKGLNVGTDNPDATRYYIKTPEDEIIVIETRKSVIEYLGCSLGFFGTKKYKNYELINKEKINKEKIDK
jgi:group I intron endonuclease